MRVFTALVVLWFVNIKIFMKVFTLSGYEERGSAS